METGMLWFDDSDQSLDKKLQRAVRFYADKYERQPTVCLVSTKTVEDEAVIAGVEVRPARTIMPNHFWIGIEEKIGRLERPKRKRGHPAGDAEGFEQLPLPDGKAA
jgi:sensor c-di-GMP phosphodiesterase-like protein